MECNYALMSYGIPISSIPWNDQGELVYKKHEKILRKYRKKEAALRGNPKKKSKSSSIDWHNAVDLPGKDDVLLGRG